MVAKAPVRKRDDVTSQKRDEDILPNTDNPGSPARFKGRPRGPARYNPTKEAVKAAKRVGATRVELMPDGCINIILGEDPAAQAGNDLDEWMARKHARQA